MPRSSFAALSLAAFLFLTGSVTADVVGDGETSPDKAAVATHYLDLAHAVYTDSAQAGVRLRTAVRNLLEHPSPDTLQAARYAWVQARIPYLQSEVLRFGNPFVDEREGQLNAWPLDEGLIDYVADDYQHEMGNVGATANIIANPTLKLGMHELQASPITPALLADLNELGGSEANVTTGYHAVEFLLWGQDLNGTQAGAGERPYSDFVTGEACTHDHCERRAQYLEAVTALLVSDLKELADGFAPNREGNYRDRVQARPPQDVIATMLYGMGSLALGELAGERMKVVLEANSTEDEQDCFSDYTHLSLYYNAKGIANVYRGQYERINGDVVQGAALADLVKQAEPALDARMQTALDRTQTATQALVDAAEGTPSMRFDQMIAPDNKKGHQLIENAIAALVEETRAIEAVARELGVTDLNPGAL